jgi:hypothetical protein
MPKTPGQKAVETKGPDELKRAGQMAAWTKKYGKNDAENPFSKENQPESAIREAKDPFIAVTHGSSTANLTMATSTLKAM